MFLLLVFICKGKSACSNFMSSAFLRLINEELLPPGLGIMSFAYRIYFPTTNITNMVTLRAVEAAETVVGL
jgi:hypothetical protein